MKKLIINISVIILMVSGLSGCETMLDTLIAMEEINSSQIEREKQQPAYAPGSITAGQHTNPYSSSDIKESQCKNSCLNINSTCISSDVSSLSCDERYHSCKQACERRY